MVQRLLMSRSPLSSTLFTRRSSVTTKDSLHSFILSLAQGIKPAVSPTIHRVKHVRRLSEDFAHPLPPPTPPPSPSLPEESESEEDDDVAESVVSDWALDGDNDEIHEEAAAGAPLADATRAEAMAEPAASHHADAATGENTLDIAVNLRSHVSASQHHPRLWSRSRSLTLRMPKRRSRMHRPSLPQGHSMQMPAPSRNLPQILRRPKSLKLPITKKLEAWRRWK